MDIDSQKRLDKVLGLQIADPAKQYAQALYRHMENTETGALFEDETGINIYYVCPATSAQGLAHVLARSTFIGLFPEPTDYSYYKAWKGSFSAHYFVAFPVDNSGYPLVRVVQPVSLENL